MLKTLTDTAPAKKKSEPPSHEVTTRSHKAPAPRPHTLDPFREVKEYITEANDYAVHLVEKIEVSSVVLSSTCSIEFIQFHVQKIFAWKTQY